MKSKYKYPSWLYPVLLVALMFVLGMSSLGLQSQIKADTVSAFTLSAELGPDQPLKFAQIAYERVGQFTLTTNDPDVVVVNALQFDAIGSMRSKIIKKLDLAPLKVGIGDKIYGLGGNWEYNYGQLQQIVKLEDPITLSSDQAVTFDVYADLSGQSTYTFGISLGGIDSDLLADGISVVGPHRTIKSF